MVNNARKAAMNVINNLNPARGFINITLKMIPNAIGALPNAAIIFNMSGYVMTVGFIIVPKVSKEYIRFVFLFYEDVGQIFI